MFTGFLCQQVEERRMFYPCKPIFKDQPKMSLVYLRWLLFTGFVVTGFASNAIAQTYSPKITPEKVTIQKKDESKAIALPKTLHNIDPLDPDQPNLAESVTSVSQLSDVRSTDWAFTALQSLVERYSCIAGYPDQSFRGKQAIARYEFAAGLNVCIDKINEIIAVGLADKVSQTDLATIKKLQEEFNPELATLRDRLNSLEIKTTRLEAQQFSTTTKLYGQALFGLQGRLENSADIAIRDGIKTTNEVDQGANITLGYNLNLSLLTQFDFFNRSILLVSLTSSNLGLNSDLGSNRDGYTLLGYEGTTANQVSLSDFSYRFKVGDNAAFILGAAGVSPAGVFRGPNRIESSGSGSISAFAQRNPILGLGGGRAGVGFDWQISDRFSLQGVYAAGDPANPITGGVTGGSYVTGLQAMISPTNSLDTALYYLHAYTTNGSLNTGIGDSLISSVVSNFSTDAIGATLNWRINPYVTLGTWGGYTKSSSEDLGTVETTNWMVYLNLPDLFKQGNLGGIYIGQPPKITSSNLSFGNIPGSINGNNTITGGQPDTTTHIEMFYVHRLTSNISITPGFIFVISPVHTATSDTITIGTIRTTFSF
jgi:hypothetical protein